MALIYGSKRDIVATLNRSTRDDLTFNDLIFSPVFKGDDETLTRIRLTVKDDGEFRESEVVVYRRLDLSKFPTLLPVWPKLPFSPTLYDLLPTLSRYLGIRFTTDDVKDAPVKEENGGYEVIIEAKETSYGWVGSFPLRFYDLPPITIPITETDIRW